MEGPSSSSPPAGARRRLRLDHAAGFLLIALVGLPWLFLVFADGPESLLAQTVLSSLGRAAGDDAAPRTLAVTLAVEPPALGSTTLTTTMRDFSLVDEQGCPVTSVRQQPHQRGRRHRGASMFCWMVVKPYVREVRLLRT